MKKQLLETKRKLANEKFLENAPSAVVEKEREKLKSFTDIMRVMEESLVRKLESMYGSFERACWEIERRRENNTCLAEYSKEWFDYVYNNDISIDEMLDVLEYNKER